MHDPYGTFRHAVYAYYQAHGRHDLPWRLPEPDGSFDPYKILVSEIMLQQTQVPRVIPKYAAFLARFPTVQALAAASLGDVLIAWQGLGYNRRAKFLWQAAQAAVREYGGALPCSVSELERLPGIGANTAGAIVAYAFDEPAVFIETNIRTVFIHHFFHDQTDVSDRAILALVQKTLPGAAGKEQERFREAEGEFTSPAPSIKTAGLSRDWYWALMDYGANLKLTVGNLSRASKVYAKQSRFAGSLRQLRGRALRLLAAGPMDARRLISELADPRAEMVLRQLEAEGLVAHHGNMYTLP
jgi:A/G-specific adenine glycosylase